MTVTIKLDPALEEQLRQRAQASGRSTSDVVRAALQLYLAQDETAGPPRSAHDLGVDLFGRHAGPVDLATRRRLGFAAGAAERHARRG
ncbi:MAG: ribbon-helix-helix protein, CopG family [Betaproteobacteria bacterium]|jgi:plasmid stability protein